MSQLKCNKDENLEKSQGQFYNGGGVTTFAVSLNCLLLSWEAVGALQYSKERKITKVATGHLDNQQNLTKIAIDLTSTKCKFDLQNIGKISFIFLVGIFFMHGCTEDEKVTSVHLAAFEIIEKSCSWYFLP